MLHAHELERGELDGREVVKMATLNAAREYGFDDLGAIAPGYIADIQLVDALDGSRPKAVFTEGVLVAEDGKYLGGDCKTADYDLPNTVNMPQITGPESFVLRVPEGYTGDTTYTAFVAMNTQEPPFDNANVRKAMAYAYNKEGYLNVKGENYHTIDSMFPMMSEYYYASDDAITYDLEKAKELLAAEGYDESNPLTFEIIGYSNNDVVMQAYQADLKSIGVNVELVTQEFGVFLENMVGMNFQMLTGGWGDTTGNPLTSAECYYSGSFGSQNISFYDNPVCDELYITAKTSNDTAEIKDACQQIQQIAWEDVPMFPTFGRNEGYVYNKNLNGVVISPSGTLSFRTATLG